MGLRRGDLEQAVSRIWEESHVGKDLPRAASRGHEGKVKQFPRAASRGHEGKDKQFPRAASRGHFHARGHGGKR